MMLSTSQKYAAKMKTVTRTTIVVDCTSGRAGQITLRISLRTSLRNSPRRAGCVLSCCNPVLGCSVTAIVLAIVLPQSSWCFCDVGPGLEGPGKLAGELGFEPRSSVLETDSLTVELTPPVVGVRRLSHSRIRLETTSFPCGPCACGRYCRTSRTPDGQWSSSCSSWLSSSCFCTPGTAV